MNVVQTSVALLHFAAGPIRPCVTNQILVYVVSRFSLPEYGPPYGGLSGGMSFGELGLLMVSHVLLVRFLSWAYQVNPVI